MKDKAKSAFAIASVLITLGFFLVVLNSAFPAMVKFVLCVVALIVCGTAVAYALKLNSWAGLILLKSQYGLKTLDGIARKYPKAAQLFADIGLVIGFGSLSYFLMGAQKGGLKQRLAVYVPGTILLVLVSFLLPVAMMSLLSMITGGAEFATAGSKLQAGLAKVEIYKYISLALLIVGGISLATTASVMAYAAIVLRAIIDAALGNGAVLAATAPGGMPILPGINLDLIQGLIALTVVLIVHEGMHGVLARKYKLPLKSAGIVLFGFLPFGAFVDIDEKKLFREKKERQNSVFVAGTAANFFTSIIFLIILLAYVALGSAAPALQSAYLARLLALIFSLNIIVGAINLVPLPLFDGYYLMKNGVRNELAAKAIVYIVAASFLLTLFPWVLR